MLPPKLFAAVVLPVSLGLGLIYLYATNVIDAPGVAMAMATVVGVPSVAGWVTRAAR